MFSRLFDRPRGESDFVSREARYEINRFRSEARRGGSRGLLAWQVMEGILPPEAADRIELEHNRYAAAERRAARGGDPTVVLPEDDLG
jgi:hypothetical protein